MDKETKKRVRHVWKTLFEDFKAGDKVIFEYHDRELKGIIEDVVERIIIIKRKEGIPKRPFYYYIYPRERRERRLRLRW